MHDLLKKLSPINDDIRQATANGDHAAVSALVCDLKKIHTQLDDIEKKEAKKISILLK